jgi:hypothetical protein
LNPPVHGSLPSVGTGKQQHPCQQLSTDAA